MQFLGPYATMSINKTRGFLYTLAKFLGDYQAVRKGKVVKRIARRTTGKATARALSKMFR